MAIESQPATFQQDSLTISPPSKKLLFFPAENYAEEGESASNDEKNMDPEGDNIAKLSGIIKENLIGHGEFSVPGLGIFSKEGEHPITFAADPAFDFSPDNFSLEAIALEEVEKQEPVQEDKIVKVSKPSETIKATKKESDQQSDVEYKKDCRKKWMMAAILVLVLFAVIALFAVLFKEDIMSLLQKLLYTEEELDIIQKWAAQ